jgi:hypothetical protein
LLCPDSAQPASFATSVAQSLILLLTTVSSLSTRPDDSESAFDPIPATACAGGANCTPYGLATLNLSWRTMLPFAVGQQWWLSLRPQSATRDFSLNATATKPPVPPNLEERGERQENGESAEKAAVLNAGTLGTTVATRQISSPSWRVGPRNTSSWRRGPCAFTTDPAATRAHTGRWTRDLHEASQELVTR